MGASVAVISIFYAAVAYLFFAFEVQGQALGLAIDHPYFQFLNEQKSITDKLFGVTTAAVLLVLGSFGIVLSHRVAGPVYRVSEHLRDMAETHNYKALSFRKSDEFPELAGAVNSLVESLKEPRPPAP